ncbi:hypothetical protein FZC76_15970 [Sutcliffiella horikoshii]|uniref:Uncharacterized protein n=1 Tax=Sutcliffiella horikoshii TaxID=79883 RepID=A0A5D4SYE0_9BACI|nr:hypothetical protein [Sutcliffiella horikoshii]TYS67024.1 hypothetical protein FZC76_15970 [Sutcliffiella horikoshii]
MTHKQKDATVAAEASYENKLEKFLPTSQEMENMNLSQFEEWVDIAILKIPEREISRNPLLHLQKQIVRTLEDTLSTEQQKETKVYESIKLYYKITNR